jgi:hypothetical protein
MHVSDGRSYDGTDGWGDASAVAGFVIVFLVLVSPLLITPLVTQAWRHLWHPERRGSSIEAE